MEVRNPDTNDRINVMSGGAIEARFVKKRTTVGNSTSEFAANGVATGMETVETGVGRGAVSTAADRADIGVFNSTLVGTTLQVTQQDVTLQRQASALANNSVLTWGDALNFGSFMMAPDWSKRVSLGAFTFAGTGTAMSQWYSNEITIQSAGFMCSFGRIESSTAGAISTTELLINGNMVNRSVYDPTSVLGDFYYGLQPVSAGDRVRVAIWTSKSVITWTSQNVSCYFLPPKVVAMQATPAMANALTTMGPPNYSAMEGTNRITVNNGTWTVDRNGYVMVSLQADVGVGAVCTINGKAASTAYAGGSGIGTLRNVFPVKIGDVVRLYVDSGTANYIGCFFIPPVVNPPLYVDGAALLSYSTEEQDTGTKWIDGKSIWQRTFGVTTASLIPVTGTVEITVPANTVNDITGCEFMRPGWGYLGSTQARMIGGSGGTSIYVSNNGMDTIPNGTALRITLKYTKM
jgi:hypothetical protein